MLFIIFIIWCFSKSKRLLDFLNTSKDKKKNYLKTDGVVCCHVNYSMCTVDSLQSVGQKSSLLIMGQGNEFIN